MQVSALSILKKTSLVKYLILGGKVLLFIGMLFFLVMKLWQHQESWHSMLQQLGSGWQSPANGWLLGALLLVPLNWVLESLKWQVLAQRIAPVSLSASVRAVLAGLSLGLITPRSLGDYAGRILIHGGGEKVRLIGAVLLNRMVQSLSTYIGGLLGILYLLWQLGLWQSENLLWLILPGLIGSCAMLLLMGPWRHGLIRGLKQLLGEKWVHWLAVIDEYSLRELLLVNSWGLLRYVVFSIQFLFMLWWAGIAAPLVLLIAGIAATFLIKSLVPAFNFLSDLGVREFSALLVFSLFGLPDAEVVAASLLLWILNICLPALAGAAVVLQLKSKEVLS